MKVVTNFNLIDYAKFANQPMNPLKLTKYLLKYEGRFKYLYTVTAVHRLTYLPPKRAILETALLCGTTTTAFSIFFSLIKKDPVNDYVNCDLKKLCGSLTKLDINTDLDLIKESKSCGNSLSFKLYKGFIPYLSHSKYIEIPSYDHNGDKTNSHVIQEHPIFTRRYVLSRGSKQPKTKLVTEAA